MTCGCIHDLSGTASAIRPGLADDLRAQIAKVIVGQDAIVDLLLTALFAEGQFSDVGSYNIKVEKKEGENGNHLKGVTIHKKAGPFEGSRNVIKAMELGTVATHMEWFAGPKGLKFSEIGCRPPGVRAWDLYAAANGFDIYIEWAMAVVHGKKAQHLSRQYSTGIIALRPTQDGRITGYQGVDEVHQRFGKWFIDEYLPPKGTPTQPVEAGYMANAWMRLKHPDYDTLRGMLNLIGQTVKVKIIKINHETHRISLGMKQLLDDPWQGIEAKYPLGARFTGRVTNITDYGAFVELEAGVEGLIHITEMTWSRRLKHPSKVVKVGDTVEVVVLEVKPSEKRVSLGIKQLEADPWTTVESRYSIGSVVEGRVRKLTDFGAFIEILPGTDGLLHISEMAHTRVERIEAQSHTLLTSSGLYHYHSLVLALGADPVRLHFWGDAGDAVLSVNLGQIRNYAAASGDRNPIHMGNLPAKAFGFPRAIAHGMWSAAAAVANVSNQLTEAVDYQVRFGRPILLPATVNLYTKAAGGPGDYDISILDRKKGFPHLTATTRAIK